jgi:hypothetical protein
MYAEDLYQFSKYFIGEQSHREVSLQNMYRGPRNAQMIIMRYQFFLGALVVACMVQFNQACNIFDVSIVCTVAIMYFIHCDS